MLDIILAHPDSQEFLIEVMTAEFETGMCETFMDMLCRHLLCCDWPWGSDDVDWNDFQNRLRIAAREKGYKTLPLEEEE